MWLAVNEEPSFGETEGIANQRRVTAKAPKKTEPPPVEKLGTWRWQQSEMSSTLAVKLGFAIGGISAGYQSRTLIAEFSRSATVEQEEGGRGRYGVAARLVVGATSVDAKAQLSIPLLAAEGSLGRSQASVSLTVNGYVGDELAKLLPTDIQTLNVDTYSSLTTSMNEIVTLIGSDKANIQPELLGIEVVDKGPVDVDTDLTRAVGITYALTRLKDGRTLEEALEAYYDKDDEVAQSAIHHVYEVLVAEGDDDGHGVARARASDLLDNYIIKQQPGSLADILRGHG